MEIFYDGAIYSIQQFGGINRYFNNLMEHLSDDVTPNLVVAGQPLGLPTCPNLTLPEGSGRLWLGKRQGD